MDKTLEVFFFFFFISKTLEVFATYLVCMTVKMVLVRVLYNIGATFVF
jgi:hypothetical protein